MTRARLWRRDRLPRRKMAKRRVAPKTYYFVIGHLQRLIPIVAVDVRLYPNERVEIAQKVAELTQILSRVNSRDGAVPTGEGSLME